MLRATKIHEELIASKGKESEKERLRAFGCIVGAFIGDALGSHHEFSKHVSEELLDKVMSQPGGGTF